MGSQRTAWWAAVSPCLSTHVPFASLQKGPAFHEVQRTGKMAADPPFCLASAVEPHELLVTLIPALLSLWHLLYGTDHRSALRIITSGRRKEISQG